MQPTSQPRPWWLWLLVVIGACGMVVTIVSVIVGAWVFSSLTPQRTEDGVCTQRLGVECDRLSPEAIGRVAEMTLPLGTTVESSRYDQFQDWRLHAVFVVPADGVELWQESLTRYPKPADQVCTGLEGRGTNRLCASGGSVEDPPWRRYTRVTQLDGSVVVEVEVFTT